MPYSVHIRFGDCLTAVVRLSRGRLSTEQRNRRQPSPINNDNKKETETVLGSLDLRWLNFGSQQNSKLK